MLSRRSLVDDGERFSTSANLQLVQLGSRSMQGTVAYTRAIIGLRKACDAGDATVRAGFVHLLIPIELLHPLSV